MNSKERVRTAIALGLPDRVPAGEFAIDFDTAERILGHETYLRAKAKSQIAFWEGRRDEVVQSWKEDSVELFRALDVYDIVNVANFGAAPPKGFNPEPPRKIAAGTWEDRFGRIYKYSEATADISLVHDPLEWEREIRLEDFLSPLDPSPPDASVFEVVDHVIAELGKDRFVMWRAGDEHELPSLGVDFPPFSERALSEYASNPEILDAAAERQFAQACARDQYWIRPGQDAVAWGQDFSYKSGPMISPAHFRRFVTKYAKERVRILKESFGLPVVKHACGNNNLLMDQFLEIGYACYQSIQGSASMDLARLKREYGGRLCLWGGMPVEDLVSGTMEGARASVRRAMEEGKSGGGYIFGSSHSIAVGTKYDNFMAMLDEFVKLREYS